LQTGPLHARDTCFAGLIRARCRGKSFESATCRLHHPLRERQSSRPTSSQSHRRVAGWRTKPDGPRVLLVLPDVLRTSTSTRPVESRGSATSAQSTRRCLNTQIVPRKSSPAWCGEGVMIN